MLGWKKSLAAALALGALVTAVVSCGDGYSEEDATTFCDQERAAFGNCFTDEVYDQCHDCYLECGASCDRAAACPENYSCREE